MTNIFPNNYTEAAHKELTKFDRIALSGNCNKSSSIGLATLGPNPVIALISNVSLLPNKTPTNSHSSISTVTDHLRADFQYFIFLLMDAMRE